MCHGTCPSCGTPYEVADPDRLEETCGMCRGEQTWQSLPSHTKDSIDAAIRRSPFAGLRAMVEMTPPIRLPHAIDVLGYRHQAGVRPDTDAR